MKELHVAKQRGLVGWVILALVFMMLLPTIVTMGGGGNRSSMTVVRDAKTKMALAEAKMALLAYAVSAASRGHFPCPADQAKSDDKSKFGTAKANCPSVVDRIGPLPWRTLGLKELVDATGTPLWYAVSSDVVIDAARINSDSSPGILSINGQSGIAAIVFSPGVRLPGQSRTSDERICDIIGGNAREDYCANNYLEATPPPPTPANPNPLAISNVDGDNTFVRNVSTDNFNDQSLEISSAELFSQLEARVLGDVKACLLDYASQNASGRFPWAHRVDTGEDDPDDNSKGYQDHSNETQGRIPDITDQSHSDTNSNWKTDCPLRGSCKSQTCSITAKSWSTDWRSLVFYVVSPKYAPSGGSIDLIVVNRPSVAAGPISDARAAILIAGKKLVGQSRDHPNANIAANMRNTPSNYLEAENLQIYNSVPPYVGRQAPASATFNDNVIIVTP